jgi:DNA-binding CsgD family transcriptional regulator
MLLPLKPGPVSVPEGGLRSPLVEPLIEAAERGDDLMPVVADILCRFGYDHFLYAVSANIPPTAETRQWAMTTLPKAWLRVYDAKDYIAIDPRVQWGLASNAPLLWTQQTFRGKSAGLDRFLDDAAGYGVASGLSFSFRWIVGGIVGGALVAFSSADPEPAPEVMDARRANIGDQMLWSHYLHEFIMKGAVNTAFRDSGALVDLAPTAAGAPLSEQQLRVLQMLVDGYSVRQIAAELGVVPRTIYMHQTGIRSKLNALNIKAAIAFAIATGIVKPKKKL